jgi:hypothetical protein
VKLYVISWSGGYESPSYAVKRSEFEAWKLALEWSNDMDEGIDTVDVLVIDTNELTIERLEW